MRPPIAATHRVTQSQEGGTFAGLKSWHFPRAENIHNFASNVSSQGPATKQFSRPRNHFLLLEQTSGNAGSLTLSGNEAAAPSDDLGACHAERHRHQRRSPP